MYVNCNHSNMTRLTAGHFRLPCRTSNANGKKYYDSNLCSYFYVAFTETARAYSNYSKLVSHYTNRAAKETNSKLEHKKRNIFYACAKIVVAQPGLF